MTWPSILFAVVLGMLIYSSMVTPSSPQQLVLRKGWWFSPDYDVTDDLRNKKRSGLNIYVDHETGIQYVGTAMGGLAVRVDAAGKPMLLRPATEGKE